MAVEVFFDIVCPEIYFSADLAEGKNAIVAIGLEGAFGDFQEEAGILDIEPGLIEGIGRIFCINFLVEVIEFIHHDLKSVFHAIDCFHKKEF